MIKEAIKLKASIDQYNVSIEKTTKSFQRFKRMFWVAYFRPVKNFPRLVILTVITLIILTLILSCNQRPQPSAYIPPNDTLVIIDSSKYYIDSAAYYFTKQMDYYHKRDSNENAYIKTQIEKYRIRGNSCADSGRKYYLLLKEFNEKLKAK